MQRNTITVEDYSLDVLSGQINISLIGGETKICQLRDFQSWMFLGETPGWANDLKTVIHVLEYYPAVCRHDLAEFLRDEQEIEVSDYRFSAPDGTLEIWATISGEAVHQFLDLEEVLRFLNKEGKFEPSQDIPERFFNGPSLRGRSFRAQQISRFLHHRAKCERSRMLLSAEADILMPAPGTAGYCSLMNERYSSHAGY